MNSVIIMDYGKLICLMLMVSLLEYSVVSNLSKSLNKAVWGTSHKYRLCAEKELRKKKKPLTLKFKTNKLVALVDNMLKLQKKYHNTRMERDKELYERQIKMVDAQIDRLVYDLYGLTEEEVKVVEESFKLGRCVIIEKYK